VSDGSVVLSERVSPGGALDLVWLSEAWVRICAISVDPPCWIAKVRAVPSEEPLVLRVPDEPRRIEIDVLDLELLPNQPIVVGVRNLSSESVLARLTIAYERLRLSGEVRA
jgi:hypothetical protein